MSSDVLVPARFLETIYQCSGCRVTSAHKHHVERHLARKNPLAACAGARLLQCRAQLSFGEAPAAAVTNNTAVHGDVNGDVVNQPVTHQHITIYAGSEADNAALVAVLADPAVVAELARAKEVSDIPAIVWKHWKGANAPAKRRNVRVDGNSVLEFRGAGEQPSRRSRDRYERDMLTRTLEAVDTSRNGVLEDVQSKLRGKGFDSRAGEVDVLSAARAYMLGGSELRKLVATGKLYMRQAHAALSAALSAGS